MLPCRLMSVVRVEMQHPLVSRLMLPRAVSEVSRMMVGEWGRR